VRWKTFTGFCNKFIQETLYQISSESPELYGRYYKKNILVSFFLNTLYFQSSSQSNKRQLIMLLSAIGPPHQSHSFTSSYFTPPPALHRTLPLQQTSQIKRHKVCYWSSIASLQHHITNDHHFPSPAKFGAELRNLLFCCRNDCSCKTEVLST